MNDTSPASHSSFVARPAAIRDWQRIGLWLVGATMAYNVVEGVVALWASQRADSIALVGFGLDSFIECMAATALLWRLGVEARRSTAESVERSERRVHRFIGGTFLALALYVLIQAGWTLWHRDAAEESVIGIILAGASLVIMPLVSWGKLRAAKVIGSAALRAEAKETLACSSLSFTLFLGLGVNALAGWWWADPVAALCMTPWLIKAGIEGLRGDDEAGCSG